jgi:hypothetical protein
MISVVRCLAAMLLVTVAFMPLRFAMAEPLHVYAAGSLTHQSGIKTTFLLYQSAGGAMTAG